MKKDGYTSCDQPDDIDPDYKKVCYLYDNFGVCTCGHLQGQHSDKAWREVKSPKFILQKKIKICGEGFHEGECKVERCQCNGYNVAYIEAQAFTELTQLHIKLTSKGFDFPVD